jgi:hypothetical protein
MREVIYMPLVDQGVECWRPVHAGHLRDDIYEVEVDEEPYGEHWAFPPRAHVRCREHVFSDGHRGLLAFEMAEHEGTGPDC